MDVVGSTITTTAATGVLSNDSDLDGDKLTVAGVSDVAHGAGTVGASLAGIYGHLTLNADGSYSYVADNSSAISSAPTGSRLQDSFAYAVSDGNGGTATGTLTVTLDRAPVVTASNTGLNAGTSVAASSLFSASDPDGNAITTYAFKDTGGGHFILDGVAEANNQEIDVTVAQLSQLTYQSVAGSVDAVQVRVGDGTMWSNWTSFTVAPALVIESFGATSLVQVGSNYFLDPVAGGTGPELKNGGVPKVAGQSGTWAPIGAEQTATGYEVAWKNSSTGLCTIWATDRTGNFSSLLASNQSGTSFTLESLETSFHQDLNGDGVIGPVTTVIEAFGSTSLVQVGGNYFLDPVAGGTGPELKNAGVPKVAGQSGTWAPIGTEQTATGYEVAWKNSSTGLYTIWATDKTGNFSSLLASNVSSASSALESLETSFHQDLNGDGVIGAPTATKPAMPASVSNAPAIITSDKDTFLFAQDFVKGEIVTGDSGVADLGRDEGMIEQLHNFVSQANQVNLTKLFGEIQSGSWHSLTDAGHENLAVQHADGTHMHASNAFTSGFFIH